MLTQILDKFARQTVSIQYATFRFLKRTKFELVSFFRLALAIYADWFRRFFDVVKSMWLAGLKSTPSTDLEKLSKHSSPLVRASVLYNRNTSKEVREALKEDNNPIIQVEMKRTEILRRDRRSA